MFAKELQKIVRKSSVASLQKWKLALFSMEICPWVVFAVLH